jgi:Flp pilus assembly protein TadD
VELDPTRATFRSNLAYAYEQRGELDRAITTAREAIKLDPKLGSAYINLGTALVKKGELDEAELAFRSAESIDPTDPRPKANLADLAELRKKRP